jgi:hypothetical protein
MNNVEATTWKTFKDTLLQHTDLDLQFQYAADKWVNAAYHITEIKQAPITSVDCGGLTNTWTEIIVQLLEPENQGQLRPMKVSKALSIINLVEKVLPLNPSATVKIEFGNSEFDTRQMFPDKMIIDDENLVVNLRPDEVQCKAINRGGSCGTQNDTDKCGAATAEKPKIELKNLVAEIECCAPNSGCC